MLPLPQQITTILARHTDGTTLAVTTADYYIVGLDYTVGDRLFAWTPGCDLFASRNAAEARNKYLEYTGQCTRTGACPAPNDGRLA